MAPALLACLTWAPALVGLGAVVPHRADPALRLAIAGLLGLGATGVAVTVVHFVAPVTPWVALAIWLAGLALAVVRRRWLLEAADRRQLLPLAALLVVAAFLARSPDFQYDTGYYHLQQVAWLQRASTYLGTANVHYRLGFNTLWSPVAAAVELPWLEGKSAFFLNLLPMLFAGQAVVVGIAGLLRGRWSFAAWLLAGGALPLASATFGVGGLFVDYSLALVTFLAWALWAAALEHREGGLGPEALPAALLSILALLLKASAAPLLAFGVVLLLVRRGSVDRSTWRTLAIAVPAALLPWLARGVAQSGCLVFPAASTCLSILPWAVPRDRVAEIARAIIDWARAPGLTAPPLDTWVPLWLPRVLADYPEAKLLPVLFLLGLALLTVVRPRLTAAFAWVAGGAALSSAFWFLTAPDMRFGLGALHALALAPAALALGGLAWAKVPPQARVAAALAPAVLAAGLMLALDGQERSGTTFNLPPWRPPVLEWPVMPEERMVRVRTRAGVMLFAPERGERCWSAPLPCTPEPDEALRFDGYYHVGR